jgi:hypothetical protein
MSFSFATFKFTDAKSAKAGLQKLSNSSVQGSKLIPEMKKAQSPKGDPLTVAMAMNKSSLSADKTKAVPKVLSNDNDDEEDSDEEEIDDEGIQ